MMQSRSVVHTRLSAQAPLTHEYKQSPSLLHALIFAAFGGFVQWVPGPAPLVHVVGLVPVATRCVVAGSLAQHTASSSSFEPSGLSDGGVVMAFPPPM